MTKVRPLKNYFSNTKTSIEENLSPCSIIAIIFFGIALRTITSLYDFSGYQKPPLYGDYEAQRHWQEITINIPINEWYTNTSKNDLLYWGLDYPPLTAYHSFGLGKLARKLNNSYVDLEISRGFFSKEHKLFMRTSVLLTDLLIYFPAAIIFTKLFQLSHRSELMGIIALLYYPGLLLIDYGHFQYNNISLGLTLAAMAAILNGKDVIATILFCLALNYKQMELYHSLPFFHYLFRKCFSFHNNLVPFRFIYFIKLASSVFIIFAICWLPWLFSIEHFTSVLTRLFPFNRGIFEDKVSNFWCVLNIFIKVRDSFSIEQNLYACLGATAVSIFPSLIILFFYPSKPGFIYAVLNSSLGFFLFSYHVHEKSILLSSLPALALLCKDPQVIFWFLQVSTFSMIPLIYKDNLIIAFMGISLLFESLFQIFYFENNKERSEKIIKNLRVVSLLGNIILTLLHIFAIAPNKYPNLYELLISIYCCIHFVFFLLYFTVKQFMVKNESKYKQ